MVKFLLRFDLLKSDCSNKFYMGLDIHIDTKHGNPPVGIGKGILQQRL